MESQLDYKNILRRYIKYVEYQEGISFIQSWYVDGSVRPNPELTDFFIKEEIEELFKFATEDAQ